MGVTESYVKVSAGGLIDGDWAFDRFAEVLADLPPISTEQDVLRDELLLVEEGRSRFGTARSLREPGSTDRDRGDHPKASPDVPVSPGSAPGVGRRGNWRQCPPSSVRRRELRRCHDNEPGDETSLARTIAEQLDDVTVVCLDDFARPSVAGWDQDRFHRQVLSPILMGKAGRYQRWDWVSDAPAEWHDVPVGGILLVEGVSSTQRNLRSIWDLTIWVETPPHVRLQRGVDRDGEAMRSTWTERWMPEEQAYLDVERPAEKVDLIIHGQAQRDQVEQ